MLHYTLLPGRGLIAVSGPDARSFLQGLVTVDVLKLEEGRLRYGALLSPQGKFMHDFFLMAEGGRIVMDAEAARLADLAGRLRMYKLRAQIDISTIPDTEVFALWGDGAMPASAAADPRHPALGWRCYGSPPEGAARQAFETYDAMRITLGVPDGSRDMIPERSLPMEFGFEALHGVDFDKGCYVGQEVTARSKFRAQLRKQLYVVRAAAPLPAAGTAAMAGEQRAGEMRSSCGALGLALLNSEMVEKTGGILQAAGMEIAASLPARAGAESAGEGNAKGV